MRVLVLEEREGYPMQVNQSFRRRRTSDPTEHGIWGNDTVENMLKEFPQLEKLVGALQKESIWSLRNPYSTTWSALFFVDYIVGISPRISLQMQPARQTLVVPSMDIPSLTYTPTLRDVERHIICNIRRR